MVSYLEKAAAVLTTNEISNKNKAEQSPPIPQNKTTNT